MPNPQRVILFAAVDPAKAQVAAAAFSAAAGRVGLAWEVRSGTYSESLGGVAVIVCVDEASFDIKDWECISSGGIGAGSQTTMRLARRSSGFSAAISLSFFAW